MKTSITYRREVADKILLYLKEHNISSCANSHAMLSEIAEAIDEPLFNLWKAYELLRIMARLELNSPNGKKGFHVLDYSPITSGLPDRPTNIRLCNKDNCPILKLLHDKWNIIEF